MDTNKTRYQIILEQISPIYGKGAMVKACAKDIDQKWDSLKSRNRSGFENEVMLELWNWFSGGGTAEIAAKKIFSNLPEEYI